MTLCLLHDGPFPQDPFALSAVRTPNRLVPIDREMLALRPFEQLGRAEVAQVLGITHQAGAKRVFRAWKRLDDVLPRSARPLALTVDRKPTRPQTRLSVPPAAAHAVILLASVLVIIWGLTRLVDIRKEL